MSREEILEYVRGYRHAVVASTGPAGEPQAALVGVAVTDALELVFDTLTSTRKSANVQRDGRVAFVFGGDGDARTLQYEGVVDAPAGEELARLQAVYLAKFPEGRERLAWEGLVYYRARPVWVRYSDYRGSEPRIVELAAARGEL